MPSENYRYYCLDASGQLHDAVWFEAATDEEAVAHVTAKHPDAKCEIWHDDRLVAQLGFERRNDAFTQTQRVLRDSRRLLRETAHLVPPRSRTGSDAR